MDTRTDTQSPALHVTDSHALIRVQGAGSHMLGVGRKVSGVPNG